MNVVDSSGWLEYFAGGGNAHFFAPAIKATDTLVIPTICIYEVFKRLVAQRGEEDALWPPESCHWGPSPICPGNRNQCSRPIVRTQDRDG